MVLKRPHSPNVQTLPAVAESVVQEEEDHIQEMSSRVEVLMLIDYNNIIIVECDLHKTIN